jgi:L-asparaginase
MSDYVPLVIYKRDGVPEIVIHGALAIFSEGKVVHHVGANPLLFGRSLTKPYQIKPIVRELRELSAKARALTLASHNAETFHLSALDEIASSAAAGEIFSQLQLPDSLPMMPLGRLGLTSKKANHPCSGKHAAILRACARHGWPSDSYLSKTHPYHAAYLQSLQQVLGSGWKPKVTAVDGCGLPTPTFQLSELAHLYEALVSRKDDDWIWSAMTENPEMIGGTERLDTLIMQACGGQVAAKEGADGLLGLAFMYEEKAVGIAIKIAHGHDPRAAGAVAHEVMKDFGFKIPASAAPHGQTIHVTEL